MFNKNRRNKKAIRDSTSISKLNLLKSNRSQAWGLDITVATVIFIVGLVTVYLYSINLSAEAREALDDLHYSGNIIASTLLLEGTPSDWQSSPEDVTLFGLTDEGKINDDKLENFSYMIKNQQNFVKGKLNTGYNFCISIAGWGEKCTLGDSHPMSANNLVRIERFVAYKNKPAKMELFIWN